VGARSRVLVAGDGELDTLDLSGTQVERFPRAPEGEPIRAPASNLAAIAQVEAARLDGATALVFPRKAMSWFRRLPQFGNHLRRSYPFAVDEEGCVVVTLQHDLPSQDFTSLATIEGAITRFYAASGRCPAILDWNTHLQIAARLPQYSVFSPIAPDAALPYLERSVDMVVLPAGDAVRWNEARRVAAAAIVSVPPIDDVGDVPGNRSPMSPPHSPSVTWSARLEETHVPSVSIVVRHAGASVESDTLTHSLRRTLPLGLDCEIIDTAGEEVSGEILVFVPNDAVLLPQWLFFALRAFQDHPDAAAVAGKVMDTEGFLATPDSLNGSSVEFPGAAPSRRDDLQTPAPPPPAIDADDPAWSYVRRLDACAPTFLITRRAFFEKLRGTSGPTGDGIDLFCRRLSESGAAIWYQPKAALIHAVSANRAPRATPMSFGAP
jgi:hypothetical protein